MDPLISLLFYMIAIQVFSHTGMLFVKKSCILILLIDFSIPSITFLCLSLLFILVYLLYFWCVHIWLLISLLPCSWFFPLSLVKLCFNRRIKWFMVYLCLDTCWPGHFLTIIAGIDLHFRHESNCLYAEPGKWTPVAAVQGEAANHYTNDEMRTYLYDIWSLFYE